MTTMSHPPEVAARVFGGVDTHKDVHVAAALDELGRLLGTGPFTTTTDGYRQLWRWLRSWFTGESQPSKPGSAGPPAAPSNTTTYKKPSTP